jgi:hypothetical protein
MRSLKVACGLVCFLVLASNVWSMSRWNEARGVYDDVCYLRQAHLFQRFGLAGFNTDISRDDDGYLAGKLKEIGFPTASDVKTAPCHTPMPASGRLVIQYPPGTGAMLALFPQGHQVIPLYVLATAAVFAVAVLAISCAGVASEVLLAGLFGCLAIYLMINPAKASYSMAPTMVVCALGGYLTARWLIGQRQNTLLILSLGVLLGLSVNFRLPNLFLSAGYALFLLGAFLSTRTMQALLQGVWFAVAFLAGMTPTLISNAINAGSPLATTYGGPDVTPPDFSLGIVWQYVADMQFVLLVLAVLAAALLLSMRSRAGIGSVALLTAANLVVNLAFFLSHPVFTPYYTVPIAMLSLWSLLFGYLLRPAEAVDGALVTRAARSCS